MADMNEAVINFIMGCPEIQAHPLYFNFAEAKDNTKQLVTVANDRILNKPYIDGSVQKRYSFTIIDFRSVIYQALVDGMVDKNENVEEVVDVQSIIDWIDEQNELKNFPDFGAGYTIDEMHCTSDVPNLNGVDTNVKPALAKYSFTIQIDYLDNTKKIWT